MSAATYTATPADLAMIQEAIGHTVKAAAQMGVIVTIDLVPQRPLAMGNYAARINVWPQRESAVLRLLQVEYSQRIPIDENIGHISIPTGLHPATAELVQRFATALAAKLRSAERQHGYTDGWQQPGWMDKCRDQLLEHLAKGDPRDVAAYCAFLWHHGEHTSGLPTAPPGVPEPLLQALRFYARQEHYHIDDSAEPVNEFDTVSGEPANWLHSMNEGDVTMIEDGSVARMALRGQVLSWMDGDEDGTPKPINGETATLSIGALPETWLRDNECISMCLLLVGIDASHDVVAAWTDADAKAAVEWAAASHFNASDNDDVIVPPRPSFLPQPWKGPEGDSSDIMTAGPSATPVSQ